MQPGERDWIERFLSHLSHERRMSVHTVSAYRRDLERLHSFCERRQYASWNGLEGREVRAFAAAEHASSISPRSIQRRLSAARTE